MICLYSFLILFCIEQLSYFPFSTVKYTIVHNKISEPFLWLRVESESLLASHFCVVFKYLSGLTLRLSHVSLLALLKQPHDPKKTEGSAVRSVLPWVLGRTPIQVDLESFLLAWGVADAVSSFEQAAALLLHQFISLIF